MKLAALYVTLFAACAVLSMPLAVTYPAAGFAMLACAFGFKACFWLRINQQA